MNSHKEIQNYLFRHKEVLEAALGLPYVWIRGKEFVIKNPEKERIDLVFQDKFDAYRGLKDATCFVLEIKKEKGDHELLGQIKKYIDCMERLGKSTSHWGRVKGITAARKYTKSGLRLLWKERIKTFLICGDVESGIKLEEKKPLRRAKICK